MDELDFAWRMIGTSLKVIGFVCLVRGFYLFATEPRRAAKDRESFTRMAADIRRRERERYIEEQERERKYWEADSRRDEHGNLPPDY